MKSERNNSENFVQNLSKSPNILAVCFCVIACFVGIGVAAFGATSQSMLIVASVGILIIFSAVFLYLYDFPILFLIRVAFIASFFIKSNETIFKINELEDPSGLNISITFLCAVILFLSDFYSDEDNKPRKVFPIYFSVAVIFLTIFAGLSAFYGSAGKLGWYSFISYLTSIFMCFVVAKHFSRRDRLKELIIGIACGIVFTGLTAVSQFFINFPEIPFLGTGTEKELLWTQAKLLSRVSAFLRTPTEMGWVISSLIPIVLAPVLAKAKEFSKLQMFILSVASVFGTIAVILSLARGSWLALIAAAGIIILFAWKNWEVKERKHYLLTVGGLFLLCSLILAPFGSRIYERLTVDDGESAAIRIPLMQVAWNMIEDNPIVGTGLSSYRTEMSRYDDTTMQVTQVFPGTVHNLFAHITAEAGVPAGILFGILLLIAVFECWKTMASRDKLLFALALGSFAAIVAYTISAIKEPGGLGSTRPPVQTCFFLIGLIMAISGCRRNSDANFYFKY